MSPLAILAQASAEASLDVAAQSASAPASGEGVVPAATPLDWGLLFMFLGLTLGFSFLCSMLEAAILSVPTTHVAVLRQAGSTAGELLYEMRANIDRPLAAILTVNTFANTFGAIGIGGQVTVIFGSVWVTLGGLIVTLLVLYCSEIVPKSLGATYAKPLAPFTAYTVRALIVVTLPFVWVAKLISGMFGGDEPHQITREEVAAVADMGELAGVLKRDESRVIRNLLRLTDVKVSDVMTPRSVVFMIQRGTSVGEVIAANDRLRFSRIPVYDESPDHVVGIATRHEIYRAMRDGRGRISVAQITRPVSVIPETASVGVALNQFVAKQEHLFQVVDEFGGTAGIITLEDCVETLLGVEIVDETDSVKDMRELAQQLMQRRREQRLSSLYERDDLTDDTVAESTTDIRADAASGAGDQNSKTSEA